MKKLREESGQGMVEFALILPILILLLGPVIDLGRVVYTKTQLQNISSDLLHMSILENEYSYQGGSFKAIEDKVYNENINKGVQGNKDGYLINNIFTKYVETGSLDSEQLSASKLSSFISIGPVKNGFNHKGHYPKLLKRVRGINDNYPYGRAGYDKYGRHVGGYSIDGYDSYGYDENGIHRNGYNSKGYDFHNFDRQGYNSKGYDINGLDRTGFDNRGVDVNGYMVGRPGEFENRYKRWELQGMETFDNSTYYREINVNVPYRMEYITVIGRKLFGDSVDLEESSSGIIYMGGDGRDVTDPVS